MHTKTSWLIECVRPSWPAALWGGVLLLAVVMAGCSPTGDVPSAGAMSAEVTVVADPDGGTDVTSLSCTFEVTEIPGAGSGAITIRASWAASCGVHKTESFAFTGGTKTFLTTYEESGYPLNKTFWVEIQWQDARGSHVVRSDQAPCSAL